MSQLLKMEIIRMLSGATEGKDKLQLRRGFQVPPTAAQINEVLYDLKSCDKVVQDGKNGKKHVWKLLDQKR